MTADFMTKTGKAVSRRDLLRFGAAGLIGCSLAASPLVTPVTFASAPWENRLVVIILRGAMDGVDVLRPVGDRHFAALRGAAGQDGARLGNGFFAMHPALAPLAPLWSAGELGFAHAVSTPYRDKRSHFDGQDVLEAGTDMDAFGRVRDGWLNRLLQSVPGTEAQTGFAIGRGDLRVLAGAAPVANWAPDTALTMDPQSFDLAERIMHDDPLFRDALYEAAELSGNDLTMLMEGGPAADEGAGFGGTDAGAMLSQMQEQMRGARAGTGHVELAAFAASRLTGASRIAAFSLGGWDTHAHQARRIAAPMTRLADCIATLKDGLGPVWGKTCVLAMTEFGRTVRLNGSGGTDHGTGGAMVLAGGALRGGQVWADWPGLEGSDLYARRDLMPTRDVRAIAAWAMRGLFGVDRSLLETAVFPGLDMGRDLRVLR